MTAQSSTMTYVVSATTRAGGAASVHARASEIAFDGSAQSGDALPGPADLLCAALSACILKNVERFANMLPFRYDSASIEVTADREESPPRIVRMHYRLRIVTDEPAARIELLHKNIRKFGTITPLVVEALAHVGLSLPSTAPPPSVFDQFKAGRHFHYFTAVYNEEHGQEYPQFPGVTQRLYWSFPDPASFEGTHDQRLARAMEVRDAIRTRLDAGPSTLPDAPRSSTTRTDSQ